MNRPLPYASLELVTFLFSHSDATHEEIHAALSPGRPHVRPHDTLRRLNHLRELGWINFQNEGSDRKQRWFVTCGAPYEVEANQVRASARKSGKPADALPVVPPRTYNFMAGHWHQPADPVQRLGATDFERYASHGVRC